jgi:transketolase
MRQIFIKTLVELAEKDERIVLLTGDLGFMSIEPFSDRFPSRFFNVGVAEQNMVGIATGLAEAGLIPFVYSIVPFAVLRPFEFIRNGPVAHSLPVRIIGIGGGVDYSTNGLTHYGLEDVGVLRTQPNMTIAVPLDNFQTRSILSQTWNQPGPVYYRIGKDNRDLFPECESNLDLIRLFFIQHGRGIAEKMVIFVMGSIVTEVLKAIQTLSEMEIFPTVCSMPLVSPAPAADIVDVLSGASLAISVEAHYVNGGIGSVIAETIAEKVHTKQKPSLVRLGFSTVPDGHTGSQEYLYTKNGVDSQSLVNVVVNHLKNGDHHEPQ